MSYAVWTESVESLLPQTDLVVFGGMEGEPTMVPWSRVLEEVGHLLEPLDIYPPRYRVREFPSAEQLAAMGSVDVARRRENMLTKVQLPKAFSVRDEHEFYPMQHLMARLNPELMVKQVATGVHVEGGGTVFWGIVYSGENPPNRQQVEDALREAGFDFEHNALTGVKLAWDKEAGSQAFRPDNALSWKI